MIYLEKFKLIRSEINEVYRWTVQIQNKLWYWDKELDRIINDLEADQLEEDAYHTKMEKEIITNNIMKTLKENEKIPENITKTEDLF